MKTVTFRIKACVVIFAVAAGFLATSAIFISAVYAQETESAASVLTASSDIPEKLLPLADELGCATKASCASSFTANFSKGLELAEKYGVYDTEQKTLAKSFKQEVLVKLVDVNEEDFEQKIIEIANNLVKNKPKLAKQLDVDAKEVKAIETIVAELKNVGTNLNICSRPAETLAREELITCLNASRKLAERADEIKVYVPEENLTTATKALNFEESLRRGEYGNLGLTADEVGMKCLRPDSPAVCDEIASKFFGEQGVKMLKEARTQVTQTEEFYRQNVSDYIFTTPDGQTLVGKEAIGKKCESAFKEKNIALVRACGEFVVKNGFATQEEVDRSLKLVQAVVDKDVNLDVCAQNPAACNNYIPAELRNEFDVMQKIDSIMRQEMGFDPIQCEQSAINPEIGKKCLEASRRALTQIEAISASSVKAQQLIANIKKQITLGETMQTQKENIKQELIISGGPGGCKNDNECNKFCAKPENGPECLAFGANKGFYKADELTQRFKMYYNPQPTVPTNYMQPIESQQQYPTLAPGTFPNSMTGGGTGPSPECLATIQAGNFEKAKQVCSVSQTMTVNQMSVEQYQQPYQQACSMIFPAPCPTGQHREQQIINGCSVFGACVLDQGITVQPPTQQPQQPCIQVPPCPSGQYHPTEFNGCLKKECVVSQWQQPVFPMTQSACTGSQIRCYNQSSPEGWCQLPPCPSSMTCTPAGGDCCSGAPADPDCGAITQPAVDSCFGGQVWCKNSSGGGWCQMPPCPVITNVCPSDQIRCYGSGSADGWCQVSPCPPITPITPTACTGSQVRCYNSGSPDGWCQTPPCPVQSTETCPNGNVRCSDSTGGSWCQMPPCPTITVCPSNQIRCYNPSSPNGWCQMSPCPSATTPTACSSDQVRCYSSSDSVGWCQISPCPTTTTPTTCPSGNYWSGTACVPSTPPTCPSGNYWDGNACVPTTPPPTTIPPATTGSCTGSQVWCTSSSGGGGWCQTPPCPSTTTPPSTSPPPGGMTCTSAGGDCCNGSSADPDCVTPPVSSCSSDQVRCYSGSSDSVGWCQISPCPPTSTVPPAACTNGQVRCYGSTSDTVGWCQISPCPPMTTSPTACTGSQVWCTSSSGGGGWCQTPPCPSATTPTACSSDQVRCYSSSDSVGWCQISPCPTTTTPTTCPSGNYWSGTACVPSTPPTCPSGNYWDGNACVPTTPPPTTPPPAPSTSCSGSQYWNGSACVDSTPPPGGMTCTSAGGDCCNGDSSDPDCGSVTPPPTTPPPPSEPSSPPPPTEPPPSSMLPLIRSSLANTLEQISIILREILQSLIQ